MTSTRQPDRSKEGELDRDEAHLGIAWPARDPLPTWEEALDALADDSDAAPRHVVRFGEQLDVQGVLAGSPEAERVIGYAVKYLVKDLGDDLGPVPDREQGDERPALAEAKAAAARRADHVARLVEALRYEPCSPGCPNWLRYGIQPTPAQPAAGLLPRQGAQAHPPRLRRPPRPRQQEVDRQGPRRPAVRPPRPRPGRPGPRPRRREFGTSHASAQPDNGGPVLWELAKQTDLDVPPLSRRLLRSIAHATRWRAEYRTARDDLDPPTEPAAPRLDADPTDSAA